jgi:hypothetical protein
MTKKEGLVSKVGLWLGWVPPFVAIFLLLPIWMSLWLLIPLFGAVINLAWVFFGLAAVFCILALVIPKKHPDLRLNMIYTMIMCIAAAIYLILDYYLNWWTTVWF